MQTILVIVIVSVASLFLGRKFYRQFFVKAEKCDGCGMNKSL